MSEHELLTVKQAAAALNLPSWKIRRATNAGLIPCYHLFNSKRYVKLAEIEAAMCKGYQAEEKSA